MSARVQWDGLNEFQQTIRQLPKEMTAEAAAIVARHAEASARTVRANYPLGPSGNLKRRVTVEADRSPDRIRGVVRSRAPHAHLFEFGTVRRRNRRGANRGVMPPAPPGQAAIPVFIRERRKMTEELIELVRLGGLFEVKAA